MTYNVHSCKGRDGTVSTERIAAVVRAEAPDVLALQEVRIGRFDPAEVDDPAARTDGVVEPPVGQLPLPPLSMIPRRRTGVDQPGEIARATGMKPLFYPLVRFAEEDYGIALLSRHPATLVRAANLPTLPDRPLLERRGAIWAEIAVNGARLQVMGTHLGLNRAERLSQVSALLGDEWSGDERCRGPVVICGDLNAWPWQSAYRLLASRFADVQRGRRWRATFPSGLPLLRIDHIFTGAGVRVVSAHVAKTRLSRVASDHLPVVADLELASEAPLVN
jgi:endonuclease/exonuclease/phosphatase family metal-dependent hydrolase